MISRYIRLDVLENKYLETPKYLNITQQMIGEYKVLTLTNGNRLDIVAYDNYSDPELWWVLALVNDLKTPFITQTINLIVPINVNNILNSINT